MTPLPKHLEEIKTYKKLSDFYYQSGNLLSKSDTKIFLELSKKYDPIDVKQTLLDYCDLMLKDLESMAKALEFFSKIKDGLFEDITESELRIVAKEALKNYREKYEVKK